MTLFFTEIYWEEPKARLFNISANNRTVVTNYDIYAAAGERSPMQLASARSGLCRASCEASQSLAPDSISTQRRCKNQGLPMGLRHRPYGNYLSKWASEPVCCLVHRMALAQDGRCYKEQNLALVTLHLGLIWLLTMGRCQNRWPGCRMQPDVPCHAGPAGAAGAAVQRCA